MALLPGRCCGRALAWTVTCLLAAPASSMDNRQEKPRFVARSRACPSKAPLHLGQRAAGGNWHWAEWGVRTDSHVTLPQHWRVAEALDACRWRAVQGYCAEVKGGFAASVPPGLAVSSDARAATTRPVHSPQLLQAPARLFRRGTTRRMLAVMALVRHWCQAQRCVIDRGVGVSCRSGSQLSLHTAQDDPGRQPSQGGPQQLVVEFSLGCPGPQPVEPWPCLSFKHSAQSWRWPGRNPARMHAHAPSSTGTGSSIPGAAAQVKTARCLWWRSPGALAYAGLGRA